MQRREFTSQAETSIPPSGRVGRSSLQAADRLSSRVGPKSQFPVHHEGWRKRSSTICHGAILQSICQTLQGARMSHDDGG